MCCVIIELVEKTYNAAMSWLSFLIVSLIVPVVLLVGVPVLRWVGKDSSFRFGLLGYRTPLSRSSEDNWREGNMYAAQVWLCVGIVFAVISLAVSFLAMRVSLDDRSLLSTVLVVVQVVLAILTIVPVELHLRHFDSRQ